MAQVTTIIHARVLRYQGHAYSPGYVGKRVYSDSLDSKGRILLVCGVTMDDVHAATPFAWAVLKSHKSLDAKLVTCPECKTRLRHAGFKYVEKS